MNANENRQSTDDRDEPEGHAAPPAPQPSPEEEVENIVEEGDTLGANFA